MLAERDVVLPERVCGVEWVKAKCGGGEVEIGWGRGGKRGWGFGHGG